MNYKFYLLFLKFITIISKNHSFKILYSKQLNLNVSQAISLMSPINWLSNLHANIDPHIATSYIHSQIITVNSHQFNDYTSQCTLYAYASPHKCIDTAMYIVCNPSTYIQHIGLGANRAPPLRTTNGAHRHHLTPRRINPFLLESAPHFARYTELSVTKWQHYTVALRSFVAH